MGKNLGVVLVVIISLLGNGNHSSFAQPNVSITPTQAQSLAGGPLLISELQARSNDTVQDEEGEFPDWIEIFNPTKTTIKLSGWFLTDDIGELSKWPFPNVSIEPGQYRLVFASGKDRRDPGQPLHTNFQLNSDGEFLALLHPDGNTFSHAFAPQFPSQNQFPKEITYGINTQFETLIAENLSNRFFLTPTPGQPNAEGVIGFLEKPQFSRPHGFYNEPCEVELTTPQPNTQIIYTTDGSLPTPENGSVFNTPIPVNNTTMIRARVFRDGYAPSLANTQTYIFLDEVIRQTRPENFPQRWDGVSGDYEMDPEVVNDSRFRDTIRDDLQSLPVLSIVMDQDDLFGRRQGIYMNPTSKGVAWERTASVELFYPNQEKEGFQINSGIRIQGGYSRLPDRRKHSFRLLFKREHGPPKLRFPLFEGSPVEEFDTITIRGNFNYTWHGMEGGFGIETARADYLRDEFSRRTQLATGQPASRGTFVHLYLNGLYWGVYNPVERPDASFAANHLGGEKEEWDTVTGGTRGVNRFQVKDGNAEAFNQIMEMAERDLALPENYKALKAYVDIDNLIDYMLTIIFAGNRDAPTIISGEGRPWNFYTDRWRKPGGQLLSFVWDAEWSLETLDVNMVDFHNGRNNPGRIFQQLRRNDEFRLRVADRVQKHFFNGGAMTAEAARARYDELVQTLDRAIVGESARWGDEEFNRARTRDDDWLPEVRRIRDDYLAQRTEIVLNQLREAELYPQINAPQFNQPGGAVDRGFLLEMNTPPSQISETMELIGIDSTWQFNQSGNDLGSRWRLNRDSDPNWQSGQALLFVENSALPAPKNTPLELGQITYYFRQAFQVPDSVRNSDEVQLQLRPVIDDGAIVYLNGREVLRQNMPEGEIAHNTLASQTVTNAQFEGPFMIETELLREGENYLAVEVHQTNANSSDIVFGLVLEAAFPTIIAEDVPIYFTMDGGDPRLEGGEIRASAQRFEQPVPLNTNVLVRARAFDGQTWSALNEAVFTIDQQQPMDDLLRENLRLTELMYNPKNGQAFEFIELTNTNIGAALDLSGVSFVDGIQYTFPQGALLPPGERLLVVNAGTDNEISAFRSEYALGATVPLFGPYVGQLANEGEELEIAASSGERILRFEYKDARGWPVQADRAGHSLVPQPQVLADKEQGLLDYGKHWQASVQVNGSPGREEPAQSDAVLINEIMPDTAGMEGTSNDWVELYNPTDEIVVLENFYLSDDDDDLLKWPIPQTEIQPGGFLVLDEQTGFNSDGNGFAFNRRGEEVFLTRALSNAQPQVVDAVAFKGQQLAYSYSRVPNGGTFMFRTEPTPGGANREPVIEAVISEILYRPALIGPLQMDNLQDEYIEVHNPTENRVNLWNALGPWRIDGGVAFTFPPNVSLLPGERLLLVPFDPNNSASARQFAQVYGINPEEVLLFGPYQGKLSNRGERLALEQPLDLDEIGMVDSWIIEDEVIYFDLQPWTNGADGNGNSLNRVDALALGNDPANWKAAAANPATAADFDTAVQLWMMYE